MSQSNSKTGFLAVPLIAVCAAAFFVGIFHAETYARSLDDSNNSKAIKAMPGGTDEATASVILAKLKSARPDLKVTSVKPSLITGLFDVEIAGSGKIYSSASGEYFIAGEMFKVSSGGIVNLSDLEKNALRAENVEKLKNDDMIVFSPAGKLKGSIYVFTDVDCGYCRLLHKEVPRLNELGVEVKYLAYPRAGIGSESYKKITSAWCSDDKPNAMNLLKAGQSIPTNVCDDNPVANQFALGQKLGVSGTPAIMLEDGTLIPGYLKADDLIKRMKL